jgi:hypothetical protein
MNLVAGEQPLRRNAKRCRHAGAIRYDILRRIARRHSGIEACIDAG